MGDINTDTIEMKYPISLIGDVFTTSDTSERPLLNSLLVFQVL